MARATSGRARRLGWVAALVPVAAVAVLAGISFAVGRLTTYPLSFLAPPGSVHPTPSWTKPCWRKLQSPHPYALPCGRVHGLVVWVQHHDPDGDGDRHLLVAAGAHLVSVKVPAGLNVGPLPGIGAVVTATGLREQGGHGEATIRVGTLDR